MPGINFPVLGTVLRCVMMFFLYSGFGTFFVLTGIMQYRIAPCSIALYFCSFRCTPFL